MTIVVDELYPAYSLIEDGEAGWMPHVEIPTDALTPEDIADYQRVEALWEAWQDRLGKIHRDARARLPR